MKFKSVLIADTKREEREKMAALIPTKKGRIAGAFFDHQRDAIKNLDLMNQLPNGKEPVIIQALFENDYTFPLMRLSKAL